MDSDPLEATERVNKALNEINESNRAVVADAYAMLSRPVHSRAYLDAVHEMSAKLSEAEFRARVEEYKTATEHVRISGAVIIIEHIQSAAKEGAIRADVANHMLSLVKAIVAGMTLEDHLEADSPQSWLDRQSAKTE